MIEENPALRAFIETIQPELIWAEVLLERTTEGFRLRHAKDRPIDPSQLASATIPELRKIATYNSLGQFRPLRAAPDLRSGWVCSCRSSEDLWRAVQELYPGSIPDWFAARQAQPPVTSYREFTNRQTGMYRITQLLSDAQATQMARACCHHRFCLKCRLWTVEGLEPDAIAAKSTIPCLEPCAVLLEFARKAARVEQEEKIDVQLTPSDLETLRGAAKIALEHRGDQERVGNVGSPANPRRIQLVLEKYQWLVNGGDQKPEKD